MDPPMINDVVAGAGGAFNLSEIWPGFNTTPYGLGLDPMVMDHSSSPNGSHSRKRHENDECAKTGTTSTSCNSNGNNNNNNSSCSKRQKGVVLSENNNNNSESKVEGSSDKAAAAAEPPKQDYIHVRARRGQATDSHSLAERARREKISERMKILQDLVPGCNKVIGKALVLDEIINYIQSLQRQVEFLSMKLEAVNARVSIDGYPSKDFAQQTFNAPGMAFGSQSTREYGRGSSPEWLHMQIGGGFERTS